MSVFASSIAAKRMKAGGMRSARLLRLKQHSGGQGSAAFSLDFTVFFLTSLDFSMFCISLHVVFYFTAVYNVCYVQCTYM